MKLLECVRILTKHDDVEPGTVGVIVEVYRGDGNPAYEVEFPLHDGNFILLTLSENEIESAEH